MHIMLPSLTILLGAIVNTKVHFSQKCVFGDSPLWHKTIQIQNTHDMHEIFISGTREGNQRVICTIMNQHDIYSGIHVGI